MNKQEALAYCSNNRIAFIDSFGPDMEDHAAAQDQLDGLIAVIGYDTKTEDFTKMLKDHGMCESEFRPY